MVGTPVAEGPKLVAPEAVAPRRDQPAPSPEFSPGAETVSPVPRASVTRAPKRSPFSELPGMPGVFGVMVLAPAVLSPEADPYRTVSAPAPAFSPEAPIARSA